MGANEKQNLLSRNSICLASVLTQTSWKLWVGAMLCRTLLEDSVWRTLVFPAPSRPSTRICLVFSWFYVEGIHLSLVCLCFILYCLDPLFFIYMPQEVRAFFSIIRTCSELDQSLAFNSSSINIFQETAPLYPHRAAWNACSDSAEPSAIDFSVFQLESDLGSIAACFLITASTSSEMVINDSALETALLTW